MNEPTPADSNISWGNLGRRTLIEVRGADRATFLHNLCTNDVKALSAGQGCEAFFTNVQGKTLCHALLFATESSIWISADGGVDETLLPHLDKYLIREDVELLNRSDEFATLVLTGDAVGAWMVAQSEGLATLSQTELRDLQHGAIGPSGADGWLARVPYAKAPACFLFVPNEKEAVWNASLLEQFGESARPESFEAARIEVGFPCSGREVTLDYLPQEISRDARAISFTKGCYLGQETVARIDALGRVNKHLVTLVFTGDSVPPEETPLQADGKDVGRITSSCWSASHGCPVALGFLRRETIENDIVIETPYGAAKILR